MTMHDGTLPPNPYVGPRSFQTGEKMYGRDTEVRRLLDLLIAERIMVLHSPSGAGKSSLIQAGLIPRLETEGFHIFPTVRINLDLPSGCRDRADCNRYAFSALMSLEEALGEEHKHPVDQLTGLTLEAYLSQREAPQDEPASKLLIFDQFEEILTVAPTDQEGKAAFFKQLGALLRDRKYWALFAIREDFIAAIDPYVRPVPTRLNNRFRLDFLGVHAALQAIQKPAQVSGVSFKEDAVEKLVNDLRQVRIQQADGSMQVESGPYVEPVQLQVVCYNLWQHLPPGTKEITLRQITDVGDVDESLASYYAEKVSEAAQACSLPERRVRDWFERHLITKQGIRGLVQMGSERSEGLDNHAIRMLENDHLVRSEKRLGSTWFELAHDRLIDPVRKNNAAWMQQNLNLLQRQAAIWIQQGRPDSLLLHGEDLENAGRWAEANPNDLTEEEKDFLADCQEAEEHRKAQIEQQRLEQERREQSLKLEAAEKLAGSERKRAEEQSKAAVSLRRRAIFLALALVLALGLAGVAGYYYQDSNKNFRDAQSQAVTADSARKLAESANETSVVNASIAQAASNLSNAERLKAEAQKGLADIASTQAIDQKNTAVVESQLRGTAQAKVTRSRADSLASVTYMLASQPDLRDLLSVEAFRILDTSQTRLALLSSLLSGQDVLFNSLGFGIPPEVSTVTQMSIQGDGQYAAWGNNDGEVVFYSVNQQEALWRKRAHSGAVPAVALCSANGEQVLATGGVDNYVRVWNPMDGSIRWSNRTPNIIAAISMSGDCSQMAVAAGAAVEIYNTQSRALLHRINQPQVISSVAMSEDGKQLAVGLPNGQIVIYLTDSKDTFTLGYQSAAVISLAWLPDNLTLASTGHQQTVNLWNTELRKPVKTYRKDIVGKSDSIAISPDGKLLAAGEGRGEVQVWDMESGEMFSSQVHTNDVEHVAFANNQGKLILASSGGDRRVILTELRVQQRLSRTVNNQGPSSMALAFNRDGNLLSAGPQDNKLVVLNIDGKTMAEPGVQVEMSRMALSADGSTLAVGGKDGSIAVVAGLDTPDPAPLPVIQAAPAAIDGLAFSPNGKTLASIYCEGGSLVNGQPACAKGVIQFWDVASGKSKHSDYTYTDIRLTSLVYSPDGYTLVCGSNGSLISWDLTNGKPRMLSNVFGGNASWISSMAFSPDGKTLAVGSQDAWVSLIDLASGASYSPLFTTPGQVFSLTYDATGGYLYSGQSDGTVLRWDASPKLWVDTACQFAGRNMAEYTEWDRYLPGDPYRLTCPQYPSGAAGS